MERLFRNLSARDTLSDEEKAQLVAACQETRHFEPRAIMVREGYTVEHSMLLVEGLVCRFRDLPNGQRQIIEIHVPGDFIDLQSFLLHRLEHSMAALDRVTVNLMRHDRLREITENAPHLTRMLWYNTLVEAAIHRQWIVSNSRRSALARIAHLFCELRVRLEVVGLADETGYDLPLVQADLADATGLTAIHVNRMLKALRDAGVLTFRDARVTISDLRRLEAVADFNPSYLFLEREWR